MIKIAIIGSGNVAQHLITAFKNSKNVEVIQVYARHTQELEKIVAKSIIINDISLLAKADMYLIAVTDKAITSVSSLFPFTNRLVVHTSGSAKLQELDSKNRRGVFYPLQTFTKNKPIDFKTIPLCLESEHDTDYNIMNEVAQSISHKVYSISSKQRQALHVAAVFVNNFVNQLYQIGHDICIEHQISFDLLKPLIQETAHKIMTASPTLAQTGPAQRNDQNTIDKHVSFLKNHVHQNIYINITKAIQQNIWKEATKNK